MQGGADFLWSSIHKLTEQSFQDFELIITKEGKMAENTNAGIKRARGELIKILYLDDYLTHKNVLKEIVHNFDEEDYWMIVGSHNNQIPHWTPNIVEGNNKLGSPSALVMRNESPLLFDETLSWLLDGELYHRMYQKYGSPKILAGDYITIGEGPHQMTHILTDSDKLQEHIYIHKKYNE